MEEFSEETDFHGWKHACRRGNRCVKRLIWAALCVGAMAAFVYLARVRFLYFRSYPYMAQPSTDRSHVPLPALLLCAEYGPDHLRAKLARTPTISDGEFVFEAETALGMRGLTKINESRKSLMFNPDAATEAAQLADLFATPTETEQANNIIPDEGITAYDIASNRLLCYDAEREPILCMSSKDLFRILPDDKQFLLSVLRRIAGIRIPDAFTHDDYVQFSQSRGVRTGKNLSRCKMRLGMELLPTDCRSEVKEVIIDGGSCLALERQYNGSGLAFNFDTTNEMTKMVEVSLVRYARDPRVLVLYVMNEGQVWTRHFGELQTFEQVLEVYFKQKVAYTRLGTPYHPIKCAERTSSECLYECMESRLTCDIYYFLPYDVRKKMTRMKPPCVFYDQRHGKPDELSKCKRQCLPSCTSIDNEIEVTKSEWDVSEDFISSHVKFTASHKLSYAQTQEAAVYTWEAMLAELGGMMGLLLGASVLSLAHCLEAGGSLIKSAVARQLRGKRSDGPLRKMRLVDPYM